MSIYKVKLFYNIFKKDDFSILDYDLCNKRTKLK